jgi:anti-sigma regulatory factor (Ser/Thr protein kinase)
VTHRREVTLSTSALARPISLSLRPAAARRQLEVFLRDERWPGDVDGIVLALHEALVNATRHGGGAGRAEAAIADDGSELVIAVCDRGGGFDAGPFVRRSPDPMAERGRGLWLISRLATAYEVRSTDGGTEVVMRFARP